MGEVTLRYPGLWLTGGAGVAWLNLLSLRQRQGAGFRYSEQRGKA